MRSAYEPVADEQDLLRRVRRLSPGTVIFDVEPLVARWDGSQEELDLGIALVLAKVTAVPGVRVVCFSTNSARLPSAIPDIPGVTVEYLVSARKPLRTGPYRQLPRPGVVIGDQILTDGILARRLAYTFLYYRPPPRGVPLGPRLLSRGGQVLRPLLFARRN